MADRTTKFNVEDAAEDVINPATKENQDTIISHLADLIGFEIAAYDYVSLGYTGDNLTSVIFKTGGSGGTTVGTLTLAYTGSNLTSITKT